MPNQRAYLNQNYNEKIETITKNYQLFMQKKNPLNYLDSGLLWEK